MPAKQSVSLRMGQVIDIDIHHPDYMPLRLALDALGGSFSARLMRTVRDEDGLTYSVGSMLRGFAQGEVGSWFIYGAFSPKLLDKGIQSIKNDDWDAQKNIYRDIIDGMAKNPNWSVDKLTEAELNVAILEDKAIQEAVQIANEGAATRLQVDQIINERITPSA